MIRYGRNTYLKESTQYFAGHLQENLERFSSLRYLEVRVNDKETFTEPIDNAYKK